MVSLSHKQRVTPTLEGGPLDAISLTAARAIEDEFARHHTGGAIQRQAKIQCIVNDAIAKAFDFATKGLSASLVIRRVHADNAPCKNEGFSEVDVNGDCLRCGAARGEACRT